MLNRLIDLIISFIDLFKFWEVVDDYEEAIVLRLGRWHRNLGPGFHFKIPMGCERVLSDTVTYAKLKLDPQSLTTKDGKSVVISAVVGYTTKNIKKLLLKVENANDVLEDATYGFVTRYVLDHTWEELVTIQALEELTAMIRQRAFNWGIEVHDVTFKDETLSRSYRFFGSVSEDR